VPWLFHPLRNRSCRGRRPRAAGEGPRRRALRSVGVWHGLRSRGERHDGHSLRPCAALAAAPRCPARASSRPVERHSRGGAAARSGLRGKPLRRPTARRADRDDGAAAAGNRAPIGPPADRHTSGGPGVSGRGRPRRKPLAPRGDSPGAGSRLWVALPRLRSARQLRSAASDHHRHAPPPRHRATDRAVAVGASSLGSLLQRRELDAVHGSPLHLTPFPLDIPRRRADALLGRSPRGTRPPLLPGEYPRGRLRNALGGDRTQPSVAARASRPAMAGRR